MTMLSFTERMAQGRELAQGQRDRSQHTGKSAAGWNYKRPVDCDRHSWEWLTKDARDHWRQQKSTILNDFRVACLNYHDDPNTWEILL